MRPIQYRIRSVPSNASAPPSRVFAARSPFASAGLMFALLCFMQLAAFSLCAIPLAAAAENGTTEITAWAMGWDGAMLGTMAIEFEKANPGYRVKVQSIPWDVGHEKIITSIMGRVPPDICQIGTTWMAEFVAMDALEPLDAYAEKPGSGLSFGQFFDGALMPCTYGGRHYGVPWYVDVRVFYYRKDLLASYGFDRFPDTWEEYLSMLRKIKEIKKTRGEKGFAACTPATEPFPFLALMWQNGADLIEPDGRKSVANRPETVESFKYLERFFDEGLSPLEDPTDVFESFESGYYPIFFSGPWTMLDLEQKKPQLKGKWAAAPAPRKKSRHTFLGGSDLAIFRDSPNKEAAFKFISFMSGAEAQLEMYRLSHCLPANRASWKMDKLASYPPLAAFGAQLAETRTPPNIPEWTRISDHLYALLEEFFKKKLTPEQAAAKLGRSIDEILVQSSARQSPEFKISVIAAICAAFALGLIIYFRHGEDSSSRFGRMGYDHCAALFLLPALSAIAVFLFVPILSAFIISLTNWDIYGFSSFSRIAFVGLGNYWKLLSDATFISALKNTLVYAFLAVPLNVSLALLTAVALNQSFIRFKGLLRLGFFLPVITTFAAVSVTWQWLYSGDIGIISRFFSHFGLSQSSWLASEYLALPAIVIMGVWKGFGYNMIVFIAALQSVPDEVYEAAAIDGANRFQQFRFVTMPMIRKTTFFVCVTTAISSLHVFAEPYIMTGGGPLDSTMSIVLYMYKQGFKYYNIGYSSAIAYALFAVMAVVTFLQFKVSARLED